MGIFLNFAQFLNVTFHLQLLQNIGCIPLIVLHILESISHQNIVTEGNTVAKKKKCINHILILHCCSVAKSRQTLLDPMNWSMPGFPILHYLLEFAQTEKEMATHSSVLAWRIPGTGEPGGLPSMGSHRVTMAWRGVARTKAE